MKYTLVNREDGSIVKWNLEQILEEINRDHSEDWIEYNENDDIKEALQHWTDWRIVG